jgi:hypothetical protein
MREIGEEFVRLRKESRAGAWSSLQERLMTNLGLLVPDATSMKDFFSLAMAIEDFLRTEQGSESMHPMEALEKWLNQGPPPVTITDDEDEMVQ